MSAILRFAVSEIKKNGVAQFKGNVPAESFQDALVDDAVLAAPIAVEMEWRVKDDEVGLKGNISGKWNLPCSRCLTTRPAEYSAKLEGRFPLSQSAIDGAEEVRQALVLAIPMQVFCRPDCKGLCLRCGANKNLKECHHA